MSDRMGKSENGTKRNGRGFDQSAWMARWTRLGSAGSPSRIASEEVEVPTRIDPSMNVLEVSRSAKGIESKDFRTENLSLSLKSSGNEEMHSSCFKPGQGTDEMKRLTSVFVHNQERGKAVVNNEEIQFHSRNPASNRTFSEGCHSWGEGTSKQPFEWMKTHPCGNLCSSSTLKPLKETLVDLSSYSVPNGLDFENNEINKGKAAVSLMMNTPPSFFSNPSPSSNLRKLEHDLCLNSSGSADDFQYRKIYNHSQEDNSMSARFKEIKSSLLFDLPSTSNHRLPLLDEGWFSKLHESSSIGLFPSKCVGLEQRKSTKSHYDSYSMPKFPDIVHDVETMKICTTVDSILGIPGGCPAFCQTTRSLLITKTDVNLLKENDTFERFISKTKENTPSDLHDLSLSLSLGSKGPKLQIVGSSIGGKEKGNVGDVEAYKVTKKNQSSAGMDNLDMDFVKKKPHPGAKSTTLYKAFNMELDFPPRTDVGSLKKVGCQSLKFTELPDINLEPPALLAPASLTENVCHGSSRTQSLDTDILLSHAEQRKPKLDLNVDNSIIADPSNRWVKRLKLSTSKYSGQTTTSSTTETLSHEKMSKYFSRIIRNSITGAEPSMKKHHDEDSELSRKTGDLKKDEGLLVELGKDDKKVLLSHAWIQRWLSNKSKITEKKAGKAVVCQPLSLKSEEEDLMKRQFGSIAAMALMGKAMNGFQPCKPQKKGPLTVWNTKAS